MADLPFISSSSSTSSPPPCDLSISRFINQSQTRCISLIHSTSTLYSLPNLFPHASIQP
ncbi:predicted protein [Arabidopsis lyrata subsp. lyrata]|uniref:Predicted protein n=1 Tax=Arabidopsis lyrata subsp. lyrata TaxID=81972 RepID=D7LSY6_ARALL|nr:predicted protein [Arabidopsis lyrata subsp. lyrata]